MAPRLSRRAAAPSNGNIPDELGELVAIVRGYVRQETVGPLRGLGRFVALGVAGSASLSIGLVLLTLAGLRALQSETRGVLDGNLSFVPYLIMVVVCGLIGFAGVRAITRTKER